jgi:ribose/xylose/arabinose/galactoside ABC-type transport system permease subunit
MTYVQLLRLRKQFMVYSWIVALIFLLILIPTHWPGAVVHGDDPGRVPLSVLLAVVGFCAIIFATTLGSSLNKENDGVEMVWTKPVTRERLAASYIALDLVAIVASYALAFVLALLVIASFGLLHIIQVDGKWLPVLVLTLGVAFMWYGLLQAMTSWQVGRGGMIIGLSWAAAAFVLPALIALTMGNPGLHQVALALNLLNPLAYLSSGSAHVHVGISAPGPTLIPQDPWVRAAMTWSFGIVGSLVAIAAWKRLEV